MSVEPGDRSEGAAPSSVRGLKLHVIILNYRVTELTLDCLRSLSACIDNVPGTHVTVCENGTGGDAEARLRAAVREHGWERWASVVALHPNRGFCGGNNAVLREALRGPDPAEYFLLLNADTLVHDRSLLELVRFMDAHAEVGIAGSRMVWPDGVVQGPPFRFPSVWTELEGAARLRPLSKILPNVSVQPAPREACRVDWVAGASMILRRTMLEQIGLLDEGLYTYFDDVELCLRARRAGWDTWFVPASVVTHLEGRSTGVSTTVVRRRPPYWFQARRRFHLRSFGPAYALLMDLAFIVGFSTWRLRRIVQRRPDPDPPSMLGDFLRNSVLLTGFTVREVENPALRAPSGPPGAG